MYPVIFITEMLFFGEVVSTLLFDSLIKVVGNLVLRLEPNPTQGYVVQSAKPLLATVEIVS